MKKICSLTFAALVLAMGALRAETTLILTAVETPDERAEILLPEITPTLGSEWGEYETVALARYQSLRAHQQEVYDRYANTQRGRTLLLARDYFISELAPRVAGVIKLQTLASALPGDPDVVTIRLVVPDQVALVDGGQTVRKQTIIVSATSPTGDLLLSQPIDRVSSRKGAEAAVFDESIFREAVEEAARVVAKRFGKEEATTAEAPSYEVGAIVWDASTARVDVAHLTSRSIGPQTASLLAGLQPSTAYSVKLTSQPLDGSLLGIESTVVAGETFENNSVVLRGEVLSALQAVGVPAYLRGKQRDELRIAQRKAISAREVTVKVVGYRERLVVPTGATTALPLTIPGKVEMNAILTVRERATGDILKSAMIKFSQPTMTQLDTLNPETTPFPVLTAVELFAERIADEIQAL